MQIQYKIASVGSYQSVAAAPLCSCCINSQHHFSSSTVEWKPSYHSAVVGYWLGKGCHLLNYQHSFLKQVLYNFCMIFSSMWFMWYCHNQDNYSQNNNLKWRWTNQGMDKYYFRKLLLLFIKVLVNIESNVGRQCWKDAKERDVLVFLTSNCTMHSRLSKRKIYT